MKRMVYGGIGIALFLGLMGLTAGAQNQAPSNSQSSSTDSLGDYARQIRKTPAAESKPKVFDNDNLPREDKLSVVGSVRDDSKASASDTESEEPPTPAPGDATAGAKAGAPTANPPKDDDAARQAAMKQWGDKLSAQKDQIDLLNRELDVLQREYQLRAAAMYADAGNRLRNSADWDKQDAQYKQQIADKQKAVDDAKQKLDDMQEDARKAGVPAAVREPE